MSTTATPTHRRRPPIGAAQSVDLADYFGGDPKPFAMVMTGSGHAADGILDGDVLVVRPQREAEDGDLAVVQLAGEARPRVRRVLRLGSGRVALWAADPAVEKLERSPDGFHLVGVVIGLVRKF